MPVPACGPAKSNTERILGIREYAVALVVLGAEVPVAGDDEKFVGRALRMVRVIVPFKYEIPEKVRVFSYTMFRHSEKKRWSGVFDSEITIVSEYDLD